AERLRAILEAFDALDDLIELGDGRRGFLIDLFERLSELRQLGAAHGNLGEHRAERAALFPGGRDQPLEIVGLLLCFSAAGQALNSIEHDAWSSSRSECGVCAVASARAQKDTGMPAYT